MTRAQAIWLVIPGSGMIGSGVSVVYAKNLSRALFVELQQVRLLRDQADMDWGRLQLELATRGALGRVARISGERLQMRVPRAEQIVVVK